VSKKAEITKLLDKGLPVKDVAKKLKVTPAYIYTTRWLAKKKLVAKGAKKKKPSRLVEALTEIAKDFPERESIVEHPSHYTMGGIETWDFIQAKRLGYNLGNVVKYVSRADYKGHDIEDLKKARQYLDREITWRENGNTIF
jgi:hypothetical protein